MAVSVTRHAARLATGLLSIHAACPTEGVLYHAAKLAGTILETGAHSREAWQAASLKPHLQGMLCALYNQATGQGDMRWGSEM